MNGCHRCRHLRQSAEARTAGQLRQMLKQIRKEVEADVLAESDYWPEGVVRVEGGPFMELPVEGGWPDVFVYYFGCTRCGARYRLSAETYHGGGGTWRPVLPREEGAG